MVIQKSVGGLDAVIDEMHRLCAALNGLSASISSARRMELCGDAVRWCFKTKEDAEAFRTRFGGERVAPETEVCKRVAID
jgi:hypothetical protein